MPSVAYCLNEYIYLCFVDKYITIYMIIMYILRRSDYPSLHKLYLIQLKHIRNAVTYYPGPYGFSATSKNVLDSWERTNFRG